MERELEAERRLVRHKKRQMIEDRNAHKINKKAKSHECGV